MAGAVEDNDDQVFDLASQHLGDNGEVVPHGCFQIDHAFAGWTDHHLFHVAVGGVQQTAALGGSQYCDGAGQSVGTQVGAFERIDGDINLGVVAAVLFADLLADVEHGGFIALAFADDDGAVHGDGIHHRTHGLGGHLVGPLAVTLPHGLGGSDGSIFDDAQEFKSEVGLEVIASSTSAGFARWLRLTLGLGSHVVSVELQPALHSRRA